MSIVVIRAILETEVMTVKPLMQTSFENTLFVPTVGIPYQSITLISGKVQNPTIGDDFHREVGFLNLRLYYPIGNGSLDAATHAELLRSTFKRGATFAKDGITVVIKGTPELTFMTDVDRYVAILKIYFYADIF